MQPVQLQQILDQWLHASLYSGLDDPHGVFVPSVRADARRIGLLLEPWEGLTAWVAAESLDQLFIHRPWKLTTEQRRELTTWDVGVLAYHLAFDESLTTGLNPTLAAACGWGKPEVLGRKEGRPLGMVCNLPTERTFAAEAARLHTQFGGLEKIVLPAAGSEASIARAAVVGAMNDALIRAAHAMGAGLYATGQWRPSAKDAVRETGIGVVVIGHHRSELWGLQALARRMREKAAGLEVLVAPAIECQPKKPRDKPGDALGKLSQ